MAHELRRSVARRGGRLALAGRPWLRQVHDLRVPHVAEHQRKEKEVSGAHVARGVLEPPKP